MDGMHGVLVDVDLTAGRVDRYEVPEAWQRAHLGGRGLGTRVLLAEQEAGVDALGPDNNLVFMTGPLTGTGVPGAARHWVGARSPLTGSLGESYSGGSFGDHLARTGFDGVIVRGQSETPVTLVVADGEARLEDATDLWGATVDEADERLTAEGGSCSCIGPAGEHQVLISSIISDRNRAAAGRGLGAVMGAKRLKAVVVRGSVNPPLADPELFERRRTVFFESLTDNAQLMQWARFGTSAGVEILNERGMLPTKNFTHSRFDEADSVGALALDDRTVDRTGCVNCPVKCKSVVRGSFAGETIESGGPEYETLVSFGSLVLNDDLDAITLANQRCNQYGLDTIGAGHAIAAVMESDDRYEWGDPDAILDLVEKISYREGIGDVLADGPEATERALDLDVGLAHVKGAPAGMHDLRSKKGMGLSAAVAPRGATHMEGFDDTVLDRPTVTSDLPIREGFLLSDTRGKPAAVKVFEDARSFVNSVVMCSHVIIEVGAHRNYDDVRALVEAATGLDLTIEDTLRVGARNFTLAKLFAFREGLTADHDMLPKRLKQPVKDKPGQPDLPTAALSEDELEGMIAEYYRLRGWTSSGITREALRLLDLAEVAESDVYLPVQGAA